ncbi:hypothetical protein ABVF61_00505 [Roseibium sp. HPY-6]|uniref:hypothetical protein n=1 Tax=Roseibium sp. HPY-6 TaxID=3229852 RepID=UPI00338F4154
MKVVLFDPPAAGLAAFFQARSAIGEAAKQTNCLDLLSEVLNPDRESVNPHLKYSSQNTALRLLFDPVDLIEVVPPNLDLDLEFGNFWQMELGWMLKSIDNVLSDPIQRAKSGLDVAMLRDSSNYRAQVAEQAVQVYVAEGSGRKSTHSDQLKAIETIKLCIDSYYDVQAIESVVTTNEATLFTPHTLLTQARTASTRKLRTSDILPVLAMSGLRIAFPALWTIDKEAIPEIREELQEEREDYLSHLRTIVPECFEGLISGNYEDVAHFADINLNNHLHVKLTELERAVAKKGEKFAKRTGLRLLEATPSLFGSLAKGEYIAGAVTALEFIVGTITGQASKPDPEEAFSEVCYIYGLKEKVAA